MASYDDISVFVIPLGKYLNINTKVNDASLELQRTSSFEQTYVKRDDIDIQTNTKPASKEHDADTPLEDIPTSIGSSPETDAAASVTDTASTSAFAASAATSSDRDD